MAPNEFGDLFDAYADLMQERVFDPIGMANSTLHVESMVALPAVAARDLNSARNLMTEIKCHGRMPVTPPSMTNSTAVTKDDSSDAKYRAP